MLTTECRFKQYLTRWRDSMGYRQTPTSKTRYNSGYVGSGAGTVGSGAVNSQTGPCIAAYQTHRPEYTSVTDLLCQ